MGFRGKFHSFRVLSSQYCISSLHFHFTWGSFVSLARDEKTQTSCSIFLFLFFIQDLVERSLLKFNFSQFQGIYS